MSRLGASIDRLQADAAVLFEAVAAASRDVEGVTRAAYGPEETAAGEILARYARENGLEAAWDGVGNLHVTRPGKGSSGKEIIIGSHLDTVLRGGNYDGLAGVVAGVILLVALRKAGIETGHSLRVIGFRCEESPWFGHAYVGSRLLMGTLSRDELKGLTHATYGKSLWQLLEGLGLDPEESLRRRQIEPARVHAYLELHIEQAPLLVALDRPVAVAHAVRGNIRHPKVTVTGEYGHSGAMPRHLRQDTVIATAKLLAAIDGEWKRLVEAGHDDLVYTTGMMQTNPAVHAMTKVPGELSWSFNVGGTQDEVVRGLYDFALAKADALAREHSVRFDFGPRAGSMASPLDPAIIEAAVKAGQDLSIPMEVMPTVGHDASTFEKQGIACGVILIRNQNGSHNPAESIEIEDFYLGVKVLGETVLSI
ncbi:hydantoinase/carbamoylase family amidase [Roseomonas sp. 18066]|uniref:hydantoinase/carbamoylase family amidase n=1 Tax=Roseomonas sp. 18066 TaxID=2681412 RepID=UPI001356DE51|nr:hydantoinase/carbamoylase family amidase [Roseomonas sp. 18066]